MSVIYSLVDPRRPWVICYVGSTIDPVARLNNYLLSFERGRAHSKALVKWFKELRDCSQTPEMEILEYVEPGCIQEAEDRWIAWASIFFTLLNHPRMGRTFRPINV